MNPPTEPFTPAQEERLRHVILLVVPEVVQHMLPAMVSEALHGKRRDLLTVRDIGREYGVDDQTVRRWMRKKWLPAPLPRVGRQRRYVWSRASVEAHLAGCQARGGRLP
jgi:hypothetical protein